MKLIYLQPLPPSWPSPFSCLIKCQFKSSFTFSIKYQQKYLHLFNFLLFGSFLIAIYICWTESVIIYYLFLSNIFIRTSFFYENPLFLLIRFVLTFWYSTTLIYLILSVFILFQCLLRAWCNLLFLLSYIIVHSAI